MGRAWVRWSLEHEELLRKMWDVSTGGKIGKLVGRSRGSVTRKARDMGLTPKQKPSRRTMEAARPGHTLEYGAPLTHNINFAVDDGMLEDIQAWATENKMGRSEAIRILVERGME